LAFRGNFLIKIFVEVLWLSILLIFYHTVFTKTETVANWDQQQYLFFVGVSFALNGLLETLFLENCQQYAELVRTGDLDFYLLKPMDEQFLVSCRTVDWSCIANVFMGAGVMLFSLRDGGWNVDVATLLLFLATMACGLAIAYSFLLMMMSLSVWFMRNQSLMEMWWLFTTLMRYPKDIFSGTIASPVGWVFTFVVPIMLVTNVPARVMLRILEPPMVLYTAGATAVLLWVSRRVFRYSLGRYRSASS
jgi:ABC-2 type transport system permease protein